MAAEAGDVPTADGAVRTMDGICGMPRSDPASRQSPEVERG